MGHPSRNKVLVKPSGKLVIAKNNAKRIRSMSAMFIARWHSARSSWGASAASTTCRAGYQGRLPAAIDAAKYLRANLRPGADDAIPPMGKFRMDRRNVRRAGRRLPGLSDRRRRCRVLVRSDVHSIADLSIASHPQLRSTFLVCDRIRSNPVPTSNLLLPPLPVCEVFHIRDAGYCTWL
jgi:hypothetical protein